MVCQINAPIKPGDKSPQVANLQDTLRLLVERKVIQFQPRRSILR